MPEVDHKVLNQTIERSLVLASKDIHADTWRYARVLTFGFKDNDEKVIIVIDPKNSTLTAYKDPIVNQDKTIRVTQQNRAGAYSSKYPDTQMYDDTIYKNSEFTIDKLNELQAKHCLEQQQKKKNGPIQK